MNKYEKQGSYLSWCFKVYKTKYIILGLIFGTLFGILIYLIYKSYDKYKECLNNFQKSLQDFFKFIPMTLYINLDKRSDRNKEFLSNFPGRDLKNHIERISGIYEDKNGNIGCLKSHIKALKRASMLNYPYILIAEDDFYIKNMNYMVESLENFFINFKEWDVLMLGQNTISSEDTNTPGVIKIISSQTTSGYVIKKDYIPKLLSIYERDLKKYEYSGVWSDFYCTDQSWKELQKVDKWYAFKPTVGIQRSSYSDISKGNVSYGV